MADKNKRKPNRIPVRFVGDDTQDEREGGEQPGAKNDSGLTPEELGHASSYEDATEMGRRINRGGEQDTDAGRASADEEDAAGSPDPSEIPRGRNEQDTTVSHADPEGKGGGGASGTSEETERREEPERRADTAAASSGPAVAELLATRAELRRVEAELKKFTEERRELLEKLARRQADFDNFRKRTERERSETYNRALGEVVRRLLPVLDNLQRALETERSLQAEESNEFRHFLQGVDLINRQFGGMLEGLGVEVVPTVGELFDPHIHEAVATEETDEVEPDTIVQEMQRGYRLGDKLLRPAMVKVAARG
ncbi:MAG: molecular chaperone GrpE [Acidobacteriota bacterium]|nr:molecular chaperone GrpE [Acidobacteriota bacterium]MDT5261982.1 molecular chaperone GrpE [Acidobacteriota bacterium]